MASWEFLLQKEGDRAWLPLESPDVEILEGRYRVVARSSSANADVEVRITHQPSDETPPQRLRPQRSARTNAEGLMVVIPYTRLKPGIWELSCTVVEPEGTATPLAPLARNSVQLQVLPVELEIGEGRELESQSPDELDAELGPVRPTAEEPEPPSLPPPITKVRPLLAVPPQPHRAGETSPLPNSQTPFPLQLTLEQDSFTAQRGHALTLYGRVDVPKVPKNSPPLPTPTANPEAQLLNCFIRAAHLQVRLRDPQNSRLLLDIRQPLPEQVAPWVFACTIYIPAECNTRVILGEAAFCNEIEPLASQAFTIITDVDHILEVIEEDFSEAQHQSEPATTSSQPSDITRKRSFLSLVEPLQETPPSNFPPPSSLPPQITARPASGTPPALDLPTFGQKMPQRRVSVPRPGTSAAPTPANFQPQPRVDALDSPQLEAATLSDGRSIAPTEQAQPTDDSIQPSSLRGDRYPASANPEPTASSEEPQKQPALVAPPTAASTPGFPALKLQERFWSRLNALANDGELSEWLKATLPSLAEEGTPAETADSAQEALQNEEPFPSFPPEPASPQPLNWEAREIVVDDEAPQERGSRWQQAEDAEDQAVAVQPPTPYVLPQNEPVPMPVLEIGSEDVIAGRRAKIRVRLPELLPRIYVKVWVYDRQTYVILDGPRWLTEFSPSAFGNTMEATAELEIAPGSMEVEFEAIAVEMQTQRESNKITVHRRVLIPPAPTLPLEGN